MLAQLFVYGDPLKSYLVGIVVPNPELFVPWANELLGGNYEYEYTTLVGKCGYVALEEGAWLSDSRDVWLWECGVGERRSRASRQSDKIKRERGTEGM